MQIRGYMAFFLIYTFYSKKKKTMAQTHILILPFRDLRSLKNLASFLKKKKKKPQTMNGKVFF